jgi:hypothetical protein
MQQPALARLPASQSRACSIFTLIHRLTGEKAVAEAMNNESERIDRGITPIAVWTSTHQRLPEWASSPRTHREIPESQ